jgi:hypothetical protein
MTRDTLSPIAVYDVEAIRNALRDSNREARCADRLLNKIRNIAFAGRVDNDVGPNHSTI